MMSRAKQIARPTAAKYETVRPTGNTPVNAIRTKRKQVLKATLITRPIRSALISGLP